MTRDDHPRLAISESVPAISALAPAWGSLAAVPCPQGPMFGIRGGQARVSATAV
jgi:hypothetical protein